MKTKNDARKTYESKIAEFSALCRNLAEYAWREYFRNGLQPLYVIGTRCPQSRIWAGFQIAEDAPDGSEYLTPEHLPRDKTRDYLAAWIREKLNREPLYIFAD